LEGVDRALVACDVDNLASARVIEKCGGIFESEVEDYREDVIKRRYWIYWRAAPRATAAMRTGKAVGLSQALTFSDPAPLSRQGNFGNTGGRENTSAAMLT
jgi:hypothetical protein